jgi:hypothetical protein
VALVEAMDVFPIKSLVSNLHPSAEGANGRKILYCEPGLPQRPSQSDDL